MRSRFNPYSSHLELGPSLWASLIKPDSIVIDMTAGKGNDTQILSNLKPAKVIAIDIQPESIAICKAKLNDVEFHVADHGEFPKELEDGSITLAVYNLGYLPGGDKKITTMTDSTLKSVERMLPKLKAGGALSITCYPGHPEGLIEETRLLEYAKTLNPLEYMISHTRFVNRNQAPSLLWIAKAV